MVTSSLTSLAEYLDTSYRPDREYLDGEVLERKMGRWEHSRVQTLLAGWFLQHEQPWQVQTATEWRTQVSGTRVRLSDVVLVRPGRQPDILADLPLLVVEILSPDDTYSDTQQRAPDYLRMGAKTIWIIDPQSRTARLCTGLSWTETTRLEVPETPIYVNTETLFAPLGNQPG